MSLLTSILEFFDGIGAALIVSCQNSEVKCTKGKVSSFVLEDIRIVLSEFGVTQAQITKSLDGKFSFSSKIPDAAHQRLRNVLASSR